MSWAAFKAFNAYCQLATPRPARPKTDRDNLYLHSREPRAVLPHLPPDLRARGDTPKTPPFQPPVLKSHLRFVSAFEIPFGLSLFPPLKVGTITVPLTGLCEVDFGGKGLQEQRSADLPDFINAL